MTPQELLDMNDDDFRTVVDQDLRSDRAAPDRTAALRAKEVVPRWLCILKTMLISVQGQLASGEAEFEALQMAIQQREQGMREQLLTVSQRHHEKRSKQLRFKSGVEAMLVQAEYLQSQFTPALALVTKERDQLVVRAHELETAIYKHRSDSYVISDHDRELWSHLPTEVV